MRMLLVLVLALASSGFARAEPLPNIILMMGDDHGWEETGYNGHPHVKTPVLDEMAASGLRFDRFYAGHCNCSPTRASYLTGRHPNRMGTFAPGWSFRPEEITIARILGKAGYASAHFGKWHVGAVKAASPLNPRAMGFDEFLSHDNFFELNPSLSRNGAPPEVIRGESSEILIREAVQFIDKSHAAKKPFFTIIWFGSPHEPYQGLPEDLELYNDLPARYSKKVSVTSNETGGQTKRPQGEVLRERYAEITAMDRAIGQLRKHLASTGLRDNTLLFYCGDNGTSDDSALGAPHRGVKSTMYEGGILVPGLIEWPAMIRTPRVTQFRGSTADLLPTICALTSQPVPERVLDGVDMSDVVTGKEHAREKPLCFWEYQWKRLESSNPTPWIDPALQEGTTPLVKLIAGKATRDFTNFRQPPVTEEDYIGPRAIIDGQLKLVIHETPNGDVRRELFNLKDDPAERNDLSAKQSEAVARLQNQLREWKSSVLKSLGGEDYSTGKP